MQPLCVHALILALMLASFSEAAWRPRAQPPAAPSGPGANRDMEAQWREALGPASPHLPGPPLQVADLSKKQAPWEEEEEAYGWMDFGRRSAEDTDTHP
ncbi:gastrin [Sorex fumeus]|uniref:gastrin n=1 Tax=Sorex fumeus TaxID=62283 RepID=UPI0024ACF7AB|nr:gastrin [Sorex fumeus]